MSQAEIAHDPIPVDLRHPQRVHYVPGRFRRTVHAIADLSHQAPRALQRSRDLAYPTSSGQQPLDLLVPVHR